MEQEQWVRLINDEKQGRVKFSEKYIKLTNKILGESTVGDGAVTAWQAHKEACNVSKLLDVLVTKKERAGKTIGGDLLKLIQYSRQWKTRFDKYEEVKEE
jgi:hypothetical protein